MRSMISEVNLPAEDSLFCIWNAHMPLECQLYSYGQASVGHLDITVTYVGAIILNIECPYATNSIEMDMHLGEPEEVGLREERVAYYYPPEDEEDHYCGAFQIAYTEKEMIIVLSSRPDVEHFVRNDRVEYFYTEDDELVYIRVKNLSLEEYKALQGTGL